MRGRNRWRENQSSYRNWSYPTYPVVFLTLPAQKGIQKYLFRKLGKFCNHFQSLPFWKCTQNAVHDLPIFPVIHSNIHHKCHQLFLGALICNLHSFKMQLSVFPYLSFHFYHLQQLVHIASTSQETTLFLLFLQHNPSKGIYYLRVFTFALFS